MRIFTVVLALALISGAKVHAQEQPPLPAARPQAPGEGKIDPDSAADKDDSNTAEDVGSGEDEEAAMPELSPLIPEQGPPAEAKAASPPVPRPKAEKPMASAPDAEDESTPADPEQTIADAPKQAKPKYDLNAARQCEAELRRFNATFEVAEPIAGEGQCGWPRPLSLKSLSRDVKIRGNIRVRCELALALARWAKEVVVPSATLHMGQKPVAVEISASYQCRRRNNGSTGKLSEHAFANGVDLMAVHFEDGKRAAVADRRGSSEGDRAFQAAVRGGACAYFTTVLGPVADANHSDHFHLDLAVRRGGYRLCQ